MERKENKTIAQTYMGNQETSIEDCNSDEEFLSCGWCEPSCSEPEPLCSAQTCTRGCLCRPPLVRHHTGHCVEQKDCMPQKCHNIKEEFVCQYGCEPRCDKRKCMRPKRCNLGCHCKLGLLRDVTGECVTADQCYQFNRFNDFNLTLITQYHSIQNTNNVSRS